MSASDRGSAAVLLLAIGVVAAGLAVVIGEVGIYLQANARAATAADAAALAAAPVTFAPFGAVGSPRDEARRFATANGARLVSCACRVDRSLAAREVEVRVRVDVDLWGLGRRSLTATSRARFDPSKLVLP
ncbi:MAG: Rv3654c family TadE-like protein [Acidimicrobiia bacterium]